MLTDYGYLLLGALERALFSNAACQHRPRPSTRLEACRWTQFVPKTCERSTFQWNLSGTGRSRVSSRSSRTAMN